MKKFWVISAGLVALSGGVFADTINLSTSTGQLVGVPSTSVFVGAQPGYPDTSNLANTTQPFWNDASSDHGGAIVHANYANVGDVLSGYATGTSPLNAANVTGGNINGSYYASPSGNGDAISVAAPGTVSGLPGTESVLPALEFNFLSSQTAMQISLLFADSSQDTGGAFGTTFGTYIVPNGGSIQTFQVGSSIADTTTPALFGTLPANYFNNGTVYGFYATVCYANNGTVCTNSVTYTTGVGNYSTNIPSGSGYLGGLGWNHFAFFELANGAWALGFSDTPWALGSPNSVSGLGDFNDAVFGITGNAPFTSATPEPGTIAIMGLGLAGLGVIGRRRFAKK